MATETEFKIGDVVRLKSGGPNMTVTQVGKDMSDVMTVWTVWFDEKSKSHEERRGYFPVASVDLWN